MRYMILTAVLLGAGCGDSPTPAPEPEYTALIGKTAGFRWAILPPESGNDIYSDWGPFFLPKAAQVRKALDGVRARPQKETTVELDPKVGDTKIWHRMLKGVIEQLSHYRCQVLGVNRKEWRRYLYLNFVHEEDFRSNEPAPPFALQNGSQHKIT